jgi:type I restriction enzyme S subunit
MAGEWEYITLEEAGVDLLDCVHKTPHDGGKGYAYIAIPQMKGGRIDFSANPRRISREDFLVWTVKAKPRANDVVLSRRCNPGETAHVPDGIEFALGQNLVLLRADGTRLHPPYLRWLVRGPQWWEQIAKFLNVGAVFDSLRCADVPKFELPIPSLPEQHAIAHILGTLDDKIELNRRMSETLEAMARALFKSWFVDFDPVRAKAEGRDPGLPRSLADLFPARLVDSDLGEIPEGWEVVTFNDVAEQLRENENPLESPDIVFRHFSIPAYDDGQWPKREPGDNIKSLKSRVPAGVVLLSKLNPEIERVWLVDVQPDDRAICSTEFVVLAPRAPHGRSYVYCLARSPLFRQELEGLVTGTSKSHQRAQVGSILGLAVIRPPEPLLRQFEKVAEPLLARTLECRREARILADLRDTLLPKLISGELRVEGAETFMERVAP